MKHLGSQHTIAANSFVTTHRERYKKETTTSPVFIWKLHESCDVLIGNIRV